MSVFETSRLPGWRSLVNVDVEAASGVMVPAWPVEPVILKPVASDSVMVYMTSEGSPSADAVSPPLRVTVAVPFLKVSGLSPSLTTG